MKKEGIQTRRRKSKKSKSPKKDEQDEKSNIIISKFIKTVLMIENLKLFLWFI